MARVLFSLLGTANYQPARYRFGTDKNTYDTRYCAQALVNRARAGGRPFGKAVLCGTQTSGWSPLVAALDSHAEPPPKGPPPILPSLSAVEIAAMAPELTRALGPAVVPQLISFGRDGNEQSAFLAIVADHVGQGDEVEFDITHGLRHLPVLALVAALAVRRLRGAKVSAIWYGAWEIAEGGVTPVMRLDGLLGLIDWLDALTVFDTTGDMSRFGRLIDEETGSEIAENLAAASFRERVLQTGTVRDVAKPVLDALERIEAGVSALIKPAIVQRIGWTRDAARVNEGFDLALRLAKNGSEVRSLTLALETAEEKILLGANIQAVPEKVIGEAVKRAAGSLRHMPYASAFDILRKLRNAVVHVGRRNLTSDPMFTSPATFAKGLEKMLGPLRNAPPEALLQEVRRQAVNPSRG